MAKTTRRRGTELLAALAALTVLWLPGPVRADEGAYSWNLPVTADMDLSSPPEKVDMWEITVDDIPPIASPAGTYFSFACLSDSGDATGSCRTVPTWHTAMQNVPLRFTRQGGGETVTLTVTGRFGDGGCDVHDGFAGGATGSYCTSGDTHAYIRTWLPREELKKIPSPGVWTAHLQMRSVMWQNTTIGGLVSDITLKVSDSTPLQVYVPHPSVALPVPRTGRSPEAVDVDTCLYDGYDNQSHRYELTLTDQTGGSGSDFVLNNVAHPDAPPLHYTVSAGTPGLGGGMDTLMPGKLSTYSGMDRVPALGKVMIRGREVSCVQWPVRLKLQPFRPLSQTPGEYQGQLNITFTPSLDTP